MYKHPPSNTRLSHIHRNRQSEKERKKERKILAKE
jgi:hypothetical protein